MFWQEEQDQELFQVPDDIVDVVYTIQARILPVDHAAALNAELDRCLPWLADEPEAALMQIQSADSGNGWISPEDGNDDYFYPSRRTRLVLRLPKKRVEAARALVGAELDIAGHPLTVKAAQVRPLSSETTLYSRYVAHPEGQEENDFLAEMAAQLRELGVRARKMVCGKSHVLKSARGPLHTRSLMLADLTPEESVRVQQRGLGPARKLGCGIFVAHKGLKNIGMAKK